MRLDWSGMYLMICHDSPASMLYSLQSDLKPSFCNLRLDVSPLHNITKVHHSIRSLWAKSVLQIFPLAIYCRLWAPAEAVLHTRI
jgi:hypothetical protein